MKGLFLCLFGLATTSLMAETNQYEMAVCEAYPTQQEVEACLREFGGQLVEPEPEPVPQGEVIGDWVLGEEKLTHYGERYIVAKTEALNTLDDDFNRKVSPTLIMQCQGDRMYIGVNWRVYVGPKNKRVAFKRPSRKVLSRPWSIMPGADEMYVSKRIAGWLMWTLRSSNKVTFMVTTDGGQKLQAKFAIKGMRDVYDRLSSICPSGFKEPGRN